MGPLCQQSLESRHTNKVTFGFHLSSFSRGHGLTTPELTEVPKGGGSSHDLMEKVPGHGSLSETIGTHIAGINPDDDLEDTIQGAHRDTVRGRADSCQQEV